MSESARNAQRITMRSAYAPSCSGVPKEKRNKMKGS